MSLKLIYGRAKSKKGEYIISEAAKSSGLIIVPESYTLFAEKKLSKNLGTLGLGNAEVMSFQRLWHSLSSSGPLSERPIDPSGKTMAISIISEKIRENLTVLKSSVTRDGFSKNLLTLFTELKRYSVFPEDLLKAAEKTEQKMLSAKLSDIYLLYEKYVEFINSGYTDKDDDLSKLAAYLKENKPFSERSIFIDRFSSFTPEEMSVIRELLKGAKSVTISLLADTKGFEFQFLSTREAGEKLLDMAKEENIACEVITLSSSIENPEFSHLEKNYFSFEPQKYESEVSSISLFAAKSIHSEAEYAARTIRNLVMSGEYRYSDISLIVRDTPYYSSIMGPLFSSFEIPYTDTDSVSSSMHPLSVYVSAVLDTVTSSFSPEPLFKFLKSGFSPCSFEEADEMENYMLETGIKGSAFQSDEKWTYRTNLYSDYELSQSDKELFSKIDKIRKKVLPPLSALKEKLKGKIDSKAFASALFDFFNDSGLQDKVLSLSEYYEKEGRTDEAARLISVYSAIIRTMDSLVASSEGVLLSSKKFSAVFKEGIDATLMKIIPSSVDSVNFISAARAKGISSPVTFILGLNQGVFPKVPAQTSILTDSDRVLLKDLNIELSRGGEYFNFEEQSLLYSALTSPEKHLYLSYHLKDQGGKGNAPSSVVSKIKELFPMIEEDTDIFGLSFGEILSAPKPTLTHTLSALNKVALGEECDKDFLKAYDWYLKNYEGRLPSIPNSFNIIKKTTPLSKEVTDSLFPDGTVTGVSKLEAYSSCPFKYYMRYILNAKERKVASFTPADTGSILHSYIDSVSRYIKDNGLSWQKITKEEVEDAAKEVTRGIIERSSYYMQNSKRALYQLARLQKLSSKMLLLIKNHFESGLFEPLGSEITFGKGKDYPEIKIPLENGFVYLTGKIDRADVLHTKRGDFLRIIDYKSGGKTFSLSSVYHGLNLQMSVYMLALSESTASNPAAMLYFKLDDPITKDEKTLSETLKMSGLLLDDAEVLSAMDKDLDGRSDFLPLELKDGAFISDSLATKENFDLLFSHVKKTIASLYSEMKKGDFSISPKALASDVQNACSFCEYAKVCGGENPSSLPKIDSKDPWSFFSEEHSFGGDNI